MANFVPMGAPPMGVPPMGSSSVRGNSNGANNRLNVTAESFNLPKTKVKRNYFSGKQSKKLLKIFSVTPMPCRELRTKIANEFNVPENSVKVWFQNHRAKLRNKMELENNGLEDNSENEGSHSAKESPQNSVLDGTNPIFNTNDPSVFNLLPKDENPGIQLLPNAFVDLNVFEPTSKKYSQMTQGQKYRTIEPHQSHSNNGNSLEYLSIDRNEITRIPLPQGYSKRITQEQREMINTILGLEHNYNPAPQTNEGLAKSLSLPFPTTSRNQSKNDDIDNYMDTRECQSDCPRPPNGTPEDVFITENMFDRQSRREALKFKHLPLTPLPSPEPENCSPETLIHCELAPLLLKLSRVNSD